MKKNNLTNGLCVIFLLTGVTVSVWAAQYPAATEPEVLYQDTDYITEHSQSETVAMSPISDEQSGYPVTDQRPEVLYQNADYIANHDSTEPETDSKFPGMNSEPEILYQDADYIAKH